MTTSPAPTLIPMTPPPGGAAPAAPPPLDWSQPKLPELAEPPNFQTQAPAETASCEPGALWMQGSVLMCGCPDCQAPMSVRIWLMTADCWRCQTSIELTEEQEKEARRLLAQQQPTSAAPTPAAAPSPAPLSPTPPTTPAAPARRRRVVAARNTTRRRVSTARRISAWLRDWLRNMPAWVISMILHAIALVILGMITMPGDKFLYYQAKRSITLNAVVDKDHKRTGQNDAVEIDSPNFDPLTPQKLLSPKARADQDARELRLVDHANPHLPELAHVKKRLEKSTSHAQLAARDPRMRTEIVRREGGTTYTEAAVARGLRWLAQEQQDDGRWRLDCRTRSDTAATSLALLPFLGAGQTHLTGRYKDTVSQGLRWLLSQQKADGDLRGYSSGNSGMYAHGQAAIVLCEAYAMTGDQILKDRAQKAIDFIVDAQYDDGGWRYLPRREAAARDRRGDTSVVGWQLMALQSARAAGLAAPDEALALGGQYLDSAQSRRGARYAYQPGNRATEVMTAEGLLCRIYLGWKSNNPALQDGARYLVEENPPSKSKTNIYYWYYATQTLHHLGGPMWEEWNLKMRDILTSTQVDRGVNAGCWEPKGPHASSGGRIYMTSLAICTLEVYYRHLPIFRQLDLK